MVDDIKEIVLAAYDPEEWNSWRNSCEDGEQFFAEDYSAWLKRLSAFIEDMRAQGVSVRTVPMRLKEFLEWARVNKKRSGTKSRAEYASYIAGKLN